MPNCHKCGKSGLFLKVNKFGLCSLCLTQVKNDSFAAMIKYDTELSIARAPANAGDMELSLFAMKNILQPIIEYEKKGFPTFEPSAAHLLQRLEADKDNFYINCFEQDYEEMKSKVLSMKVNKAKLVRIDKFLMYLDKFKSHMDNPSLSVPIYKKVETLQKSIT